MLDAVDLFFKREINYDVYPTDIQQACVINNLNQYKPAMTHTGPQKVYN